ncbi:MAG: hypothetical protein IJK00_06685 [Clostridia bacterium]|nr:hypothetical protein [Clostridia bacterium]MBR6135309.1 hypothetical protein [Clostridia bacterium]
MKKLFLVLFTALFIFMIVSCAKQTPEAGRYKLTEMVKDGKTTSKDVLDYMEKNMNLVCTMDLHEDGTGELLLFDETRDFKWDHKSFTIISGNENLSYTYKKGTLTVTSKGMTLIFTKIDQ